MSVEYKFDFLYIALKFEKYGDIVQLCSPYKLLCVLTGIFKNM